MSCRKKFNRALAAALFLLGAAHSHALIGVAYQMQLGNPSNATGDTNNHSHYLIQRTVEALDYSDNLGLPNWASWDLTASDTGTNARSPVFFVDTNLPANFHRVGTDEYVGSGYDRGHMCPSADRTDTDTNNDMVFFMSNIIPQAPVNNQGVWAQFETYCRTLAQASNEVLIICGPSGFNGSKLPSDYVAIPSNVWKVVVVVPEGSGTALTRITVTNRVISLRIPNTSAATNDWQYYITTARDIELECGLTFFTALPGPVASAFRSRIDGLTNAPPPAITSFTPGGGLVNATVIINGTNFNSVSAVRFNGSSATFSVDSNTQITTVVPTNATSGFLTVTTPGGTASSLGSFTVISGSAPDLAVVAAHAGSFTQGDFGRTMTITVTNPGTVAATGAISVTNTLPVGLTATAMSGTGWNVNLGSLTASRSDALAAGAAYPALNLTVNVASNAAAVLTNVVIVAGGGDLSPGNNTGLDVIPVAALGVTGVLAGWDVSGQTNFGTSPLAPTVSASNLTAGNLLRGAGVGTGGSAAARAWGGNSWTATTSATAIASNQFIAFILTAKPGFLVSYSAISPFDYRRSTTGPTNGLLQYQVGAGAFIDITNLAYTAGTSAGGSLGPINLAGIVALQYVPAGTDVTFRLANWAGTSSAGTWYLFDVASNSAPDLAIQGTVLPVAMPQPLNLSGFIGANGFTVQSTGGVAGVTYWLQVATNLAPPIVWNSILTNSAATNGWIQFVDPSATNAPLRFYRTITTP